VKSPVIGITCATHPTEERYYIVKDYVKAVAAAGGSPVLIAPLGAEARIAQIAGFLDGLLLSGGKDLDPKLYGQEPVGVWRIDPEKDALEMALARTALKRDIPILGICRGCQVLNVLGGGNLIQHLSVKDKKIKHWQTAPDNYPTHELELTKGTKLREIIGRERVRVNSFHHQGIGDVAKGYSVSAVAADGTIEGLESNSHSWVIGIQFHIEYLWEEYPEFNRVFTDFVKAASVR